MAESPQAAGNFRIETLASGAVEVLSAEEIIARFAPGLATQAEKNEWFDLMSIETSLHKAVGITLTKVDPRQIFDEYNAVYQSDKAALAKTKAKQEKALIDVLNELTEDEISKGAVHKVSKTAKDITIVEFYLAKANPKLENLLKISFPKHVKAELLKIHGVRGAAAAKREAAKAAKN